MAKVPPGITLAQADARYNQSAKTTIDVTSHSTTLTDSESGAAVIVFSGALTGDLTFQLSETSRVQRIDNSTTGAYTLSVKRGAGGTAYPVTQGETMEIR